METRKNLLDNVPIFPGRSPSLPAKCPSVRQHPFAPLLILLLLVSRKHSQSFLLQSFCNLLLYLLYCTFLIVRNFVYVRVRFVVSSSSCLCTCPAGRSVCNRHQCAPWTNQRTTLSRRREPILTVAIARRARSGLDDPINVVGAHRAQSLESRGKFVVGAFYRMGGTITKQRNQTAIRCVPHFSPKRCAQCVRVGESFN